MVKTIHRQEYRQLLDDLRERRLGLGLTQRDAAAALGWAQQKLSYAETGVRRLDVFEYIQLSRLLGISPAGAFARAERKLRTQPKIKRVQSGRR